MWTKLVRNLRIHFCVSYFDFLTHPMQVLLLQAFDALQWLKVMLIVRRNHNCGLAHKVSLWVWYVAWSLRFDHERVVFIVMVVHSLQLLTTTDYWLLIYNNVIRQPSFYSNGCSQSTTTDYYRLLIIDIQQCYKTTNHTIPINSEMHELSSTFLSQCMHLCEMSLFMLVLVGNACRTSDRASNWMQLIGLSSSFKAK